MKTISTNKKERKQKKSILDPFHDEIEYYHSLGVTVPNIARIMNEKTPIKLSSAAYRNFISTRVNENKNEP